MDAVNRADRLTERERLLLLIATVPIALLSLGALLIPDAFAHLLIPALATKASNTCEVG